MSSDTTQTSEVIHEIIRAIQELRFGSIEITVHEGRVTQIERREKIRFNVITEKHGIEKQQNQHHIRSKPTATAAANT
ncbi:MAG: YezD family protein [Pseudomonadota bacterium]